MGDVAVGARSGADEPEERAVTPDEGTSQQEPPGGEPPESGESGSDGHKKAKKQRSFWKELPILIGIAIILALIIKTFLLQAFSIPSDSMQNTLQRGDRVLVDKLTPWFGATPDRGEVVVFNDPGGWLGENPAQDTGGFAHTMQQWLSLIGLMPSAEDQDLIKRVIAVGGDTIECEQDGPITINGEPLDEREYLFPGNTPCGDRPFGPIDIPEGDLWVLGDHRQDSLDSRYHQDLPGGGTVSTDEVVGRAIVVAWPVNRWSVLSVPDSFGRLGETVGAAAPAALGLVGAVPLVLLRRRWLLGRESARADAKPTTG